MIACDDVFDILTRGPFPSGDASDSLVESHLASCPGCHRLAEALRPAVELFEESIGPEEGRYLPRYWGDASSDAADLWERETAVVARPRPKPRSTNRTWERFAPAGRNIARFLAAAAVGAVIAAAANPNHWVRPGESIFPPASAESADGGANAAPLLAVANPFDHLPRACRALNMHRHDSSAENETGLVPQPEKENEQACCTECHRIGNPKAGQAAPPNKATAEVSQVCSTCHNARLRP